MPRKIANAKKTLLLNQDLRSLRVAARIIKKGGLVAFPTETVYGLGADATNPRAVRRIFSAKGRPPDNPLIVHLASVEQVKGVSGRFPPYAKLLAEKFWPGPLSIVLPGAGITAPEVSAGLNSIAVRIPDHPAALALIREAGIPLAAPSANRSGRPSPTSYRHVLEDLTGRIDAVIRGKKSALGVESTVIDLTGSKPVILRPGGVTREALESVLGMKLAVAGLTECGAVPRSPGMKYRHYSPRAPLILITGPEKNRRLFVDSAINYYNRQKMLVGHLGRAVHNILSAEPCTEEIAANLFFAMREFDRLGVSLILAEEEERRGLGLAVNNRLRKAATRVLKIS